MNQKWLVAGLIVFALILNCSLVFAKDKPCNMIEKGTRGASNILFAFLEMPNAVEKTGNEKGALAGATTGVAKGLYRSAERLVVGVYEVATFFLPPYGPVINEPEFFLEKAQDEKYPIRKPISPIYLEQNQGVAAVEPDAILVEEDEAQVEEMDESPAESQDADVEEPAPAEEIMDEAVPEEESLEEAVGSIEETADPEEPAIQE